MRSLHCFVLALVVCSMLAVAGCTTNAAPAAPATHTPSVSLAPLAIDRTDLPDGYVLTMSRAKTEAEMSSLAKSLGWQAGYVAEYTQSGGENPTGCVVLHTLATYPESSMPDIINYVNKTEHSYSNVIYTDFPVTGLGTGSKAFIGGVQNNGMPVAETTTGSSSLPVAAETIGEKTRENTYDQNFVEVVFSKGTTFEVIRMSCTAIDAEQAIAIAQKAYKKIP